MQKSPQPYCTKEFAPLPMARILKKIKFTSKLDKFSPESGWHFIAVTADMVSKFTFEEKSKRVVCTLNGTETFQCALMPYDGHFFVMINKGARSRLKVEAGDLVAVEIAKDESKYGLPMPEELREVLNQDPEGDRYFHQLTPGKQRSLLYFIGKFKDIDKRIHASLVLMAHLHKNDGKLIHEDLHEELKRPSY